MPDLYGLPVADLPEGWQPVEALVIVKCLVPETGGFPYRLRTNVTSGMSMWEAAGMLDFARADTIQQYVRRLNGG